MKEIENILVKHYAGSHAYGTNIATSDVDFRGIFYVPFKSLISPYENTGEMSDSKEEDTKYYEIRKFIKLYTDCNPNIVETLWVDESDIVFRTNVYDLLRDNRKELLSSKAAFTYTGYAHNQMVRMKNHVLHINNTHEIKPEQVDFLSLVLDIKNINTSRFSLRNYLHGYRLVPLKDNIYGLYTEPGYTCYNIHDGSLKKENPSESFFKQKPGFLESLCNMFTMSNVTTRLPVLVLKFNVKEYDDAMNKHRNYCTWRENRNEMRSELERLHSYDTKHGMHLIRLLRTGEEILRTGEVLVKRPDAIELLDIRNGKWLYDDLLKYANEKDEYIRNVLYKETSLPKKPNIKLATEIAAECYDIIFKGNIKVTKDIR